MTMGSLIGSLLHGCKLRFIAVVTVTVCHAYDVVEGH
jgi:hypothetical protein